MSSTHHFYPLDIRLVDYAANTATTFELLGAFTAATVVILGAGLGFAKWTRPLMSKCDSLLVAWFVFTGSIHLFLEGYYVVNHLHMPGRMDLLGQMWKEYAKSDSRYLTVDPFVICMETVTAFAWGPLSFITAWFIIQDSPLRYPIQALVSTGQFYGDLLYYSTSILDWYYQEVSYSRPEMFYFWGYFIFLNTFWMIIPGLCIYDSIKVSADAIALFQKHKSNSKRNAKKEL